MTISYTTMKGYKVGGLNATFDELKDFIISPENLKDFVSNKSKYLSLRSGWSLPSFTDFKDLQPEMLSKVTNGIICILMHKCSNLIVIDYDNMALYEKAKATFEGYCRADRSQKGGHIWLHLTDDQVARLTNTLKTPKSLKDVQYYISGKEGLIFHSSVVYYKNEVYSDLAKSLPGTLVDKIIDEYFLLSESSTASKSIESPKIVGKNWTNNKSIADFIKRSVESGIIDIYEFKQLYDYSDRVYKLENLAKGNRTNTLWAIAAWAGACGWLTPKEWCDFLYLVREVFCPEYEIDRFEKTIVGKKNRNYIKKFREKGFVTPEVSQELEKHIIEHKVTVDTLPDIFIAESVSPKSKEHTHIYADLRDPRRPFLYVSSMDLVIGMAENHPVLRRQIKFNDKGKPYLSNLPRVELVYGPGSSTKVEFDSFSNCFKLNLSALSYNGDIEKIILAKNYSKYDDTYLKDLSDWFEDSPLNKMFKLNWMPDKRVRLKFQGDLGHFLATNEGSSTMCIIQDPGNTGKSYLLEQTLDFLMFGDLDKSEVKYNSLSGDRVLNLRQALKSHPTASKIVKSSFNDWANARFICIHEDGGDVDEEKLATRLQAKIKNKEFDYEGKGKASVSLQNHSFLLRFTNNLNPLDEDLSINTRYYFSRGQTNISFGSEETTMLKKKLNETFGEGIDTAQHLLLLIKRDIYRYLEYFILVAPYVDGYPGYYSLPKTELSVSIQSIEDIEELKEMYSENPLKYVRKLIQKSINSDKTPNREFLKLLYSYKDTKDLAYALIHTARKYINVDDIPLEPPMVGEVYYAGNSSLKVKELASIVKKKYLSDMAPVHFMKQFREFKIFLCKEFTCYTDNFDARISYKGVYND